MSTINTIIKQRFVSCPLAGGDVALDADAGEHLYIEAAAGVTVTVTLPDSSTCVGAPVMVHRRGAGGQINVIPLDRVDAFDDRDSSGIQIGPSGDGYECVALLALDNNAWAVTARG